MRTVADVMTGDPVTVSPDASFKEIVRVMRGRGVSALPVVDGKGDVLGMVSEYDMLQKERFPCSEVGPVFEGRRSRIDRRKADAESANELMTSPAVTIGIGRSLREAACLMSEHRIKRLVVVDTEGRLCGILSRRDLLEVFLREDDDIRTDVLTSVTVDGLDVSTSELEVGVDDGVVTLEGRLPHRSTADRVVELAERVEGVTAVHDRTTWELDDVTPDRRWPAWPAVG